MKTIFASALVASTLFAGAAFASAESDHNGSPVLKTTVEAQAFGTSQAFDRSVSLGGSIFVLAASNDPARGAINNGK